METPARIGFGVYRVVRLLGRGGMGEVYEVEHPQLGVHYALKAFAREAADADALRARFLAEPRGTAEPHAVRRYHLVDERLYIGKGVGEMVDFGGLLGYAPIIPVNKFGCDEFVNRRGRIPAPVHSFKN